MATIYVDHRENALERFSNKKSPVSYLDKVIDASNRKRGSKHASAGGGVINFKLCELSVGDYTVVLPGNILALVIERKEWKDLGASISDGRADRQTKNLREAKIKYGCEAYLLVEGKFSYKDETVIGGEHGKPFGALHSKLRHELIRGIPFIQSKDPESSVEIIVKLARDMIQLRAREEIIFPLQLPGSEDGKLLRAYIDKIRKLNEEFTELADGAANITMAIGDISEQLDFFSLSVDEMPVDEAVNASSEMPESFAKRKAAGNADIVANMWTAIPGVTANSAPVLSSVYHISDLFTGVATVEDMREMKFASGIRMGKQADKIASGFSDADKMRATGTRVLSAIPGISEDAAAAILELYDIPRLCDKKRTTVETISNIEQSNGRAIGAARAKKLLLFIQKTTAV